MGIERLGDPADDLIGTSRPMRELLALLRKVAPHSMAVLVTGDTGTGKELIARTIHHLGPRRDCPLVAISCSALGEALSESEIFGHVRGAFTGLTESVSMIADAMGWKLDKITDEIHPKIATDTVASEYLAVDAGYVCGLVQDGIGYRNGKPVVTLHMEAYLGAPESFDSVEITGSPNIKSKIAGGVHGDVATASITVNSIPKILEVAPGLHTMRDMPIPSYFGG